MNKAARFVMTLAFVFALTLGAFGGSAPASAATTTGLGADEPTHIVVLKDSVKDVDAKVNTQIARHGLGSANNVYKYSIKGYAAKLNKSSYAALLADPDVAYIMPNKVVTISDFKVDGTAVTPLAAQVLPTGIKRIGGDVSSTLAGNGSGSVTNIAVAVIDTGIDKTHPDLNVVGGYNCSGGSKTNYSDGNGHGTHVSGTIGAKDDGVGVVGVAPGVPLYAVRVLNNQGSGTSATVICGIDWVAQNAAAKNIKVANMSLGGTGTDRGNCGAGVDAQHAAVCRLVNNAGVTLAVAAGNETDNTANHTPGAYDEGITVSALADFDGLPGGLGASTCRADGDDTFADFSNYGSDVDIIAPGVCIYSTWMGSAYNTISGTSMATPHVAGAAALYISRHPGLTPAQVKAALQTAGNTNWNNADDHDTTKEKLLNVSTF